MVDDRKVLVVGNLSEAIVERMRATGMAVVRQEDGINGMQATLIAADEFYAEQPVDMFPLDRQRMLDAYPFWPDSYEPVIDAHRYTSSGIRGGKTEAMLRAIQEEMGLIDHAGPDYIYDGMGFRSVRPPVAPRREIQFIDTPKPMTRRKARRQRAQRKAKP
jgi:hypothetical protein